MFNVDLTGKIAWVTGGSRGIGRAAAIALSQAGADVAVAYSTKSAEADQVVAEIQALGRKALAIQVDVAKQESCNEAYDKIVAGLGKVDILVNSAGVTADNLFPMLEE